MERRRDVIALLVLLGIGLAYQLCLVRQGVGLIDEGHLANAARRMAAGEILYRDVYTVYPPASFHAVSALFGIFGTSLITVRAFHVAMTLALAVLVFVASRRLMETPFALLAGALVAATGWHVIHEGCHYAYLYGAVPMAALLLAARADARGAFEGEACERGTLVLFGALAGLALAFRLEPFVGLVLAGTGVVLLRGGVGAASVARLAWIALGTLLVVLPIGAWYAIQGAFADLFLAVFWTSFGQYLQGGEFNLPMPGFAWLPEEWSRRGLRRLFIGWEFRAPVVLYSVAVAEVGIAAWRRRRAIRAAGKEPAGSAVIAHADRIAPEAVARAALAVLGSVLYLRATGRSDYYHLAPILFPAYVLGSDWIARAWRRWVPARLGALAGPLAYALVASVLASSLFVHEFDRAVRRALDRTNEVEIVPGGPLIDRAQFLDDLVADVRRRTRPDEPIVVLPWHPIVYFLTERANPTKYDWLFPGYLTTEPAVEAFLDAIDRSRTRVVVYSPISIDGLPDRSLAAFAPEIDRYLRDRFEPVKRYGRFWVMTRRADAGEGR